MTGADIKLTDEQVELVQRLQKGQFGDVHFDPYEVRWWRALRARGARCRARPARCSHASPCVPSRPSTSSATR